MGLIMCIIFVFMFYFVVSMVTSQETVRLGGVQRYDDEELESPVYRSF